MTRLRLNIPGAMARFYTFSTTVQYTPYRLHVPRKQKRIGIPLQARMSQALPGPCRKQPGRDDSHDPAFGQGSWQLGDEAAYPRQQPRAHSCQLLNLDWVACACRGPTSRANCLGAFLMCRHPLHPNQRLGWEYRFGSPVRAP